MNHPEELKISGHAEIESAARALLNHCKNHFFFAFYGNLGVGKTTLIKAICKLLGNEDNVASPTFSIVNEYQIKSGNSTNKGMIFHMDFYRLKNLQEALDIGIDEYFKREDAWCFIEWPQVVEPLLPTETIKVTMNLEKDNSRTIRIDK